MSLVAPSKPCSKIWTGFGQIWVDINGENRSPLSPVRRNSFPYLYLDCGRQLCRTETGGGLVLENLGSESLHRNNVHNPHTYRFNFCTQRRSLVSLFFAQKEICALPLFVYPHTFNWFCFSWQETLSEFASTPIFAMPGNAIGYT